MAKNDFWGDFFFMTSLVTPRIIKIINMVVIIFLGLGVIASIFGGFVSFIMGVVGAVAAYVFLRIWLEVALVLFRIEENTRSKKK
ncbi:DUF4282 domain-containing protein [Candidatus Woesearchaeota archaeon]|nr:DUF4282 domain-containing protein [Candidatus Woesearchaeota archaeon]